MTAVLRHVGPQAPTADVTLQKEKQEHATFRPDVQGLRALAVSLVVLYHLYPHLVTGGYIGVDVFFVISGYLITGLLARSLATTGKVDLLGFYARRARRLLPAAILVLTTTWVVGRMVLPVTQLPAAATQIRASALYFQNWVLAGNSTDYLKSDQAASPVQHFWSLSVEEQFYLFWPLIFIAASIVAALVYRRAAAHHAHRKAVLRRGVAIAIALAIIVASLRFSAIDTVAHPAAAYFETSTRVWELGVGGLLALLPRALMGRLARFGPLSWIGLVVVIVSACLIKGSSAFPGTIALWPVLGTAAVLVCGSASGRFSTAPLTSLRPAVFIGDISYGIYLWHWPLIVLWQAYHGSGIGYLDGPAVIIASVVLAYFTKRLVEDPIRTWKKIARSTTWSLSVAALAAVPVVLVSVFLVGLPGPVHAKIDASHPGAAALSAAAGQQRFASAKIVAPAPPPPATKDTLIPSLAQVATDFQLGSKPNCKAGLASTTAMSCTFGDVATPKLTVALVGDSHAAEWSTAMDAIGKHEHWKIVSIAHDSCPFGSTMNVIKGTTVPFTACQTWGKNVMNLLLTSVHPDVVIVSERPANGIVGDNKADPTSMASIGKGMADYWQQLIAHNIKVVAIHETPEPGKNIPDCLAERSNTIASCAVSAQTAVTQSTPIDAASKIVGSAVPVVDMTKYICTPTVCPAVVGNVIVYRDNQHLSQTYTMSIEPYLLAALVKLPALSGAGS